MKLPKSFFKGDSYVLTPDARQALKNSFKNHEFQKLRGELGLTLGPDSICPWPWPRPPFRNLSRWNENSQFEAYRVPISFSNDRSGLWYPDPEDDEPWPWPLGPLVKDFLSERIYSWILEKPIKDHSFELVDVLKRERIIEESLEEFEKELGAIQYTIKSRLKHLK
ncbi:hypothetical protein ACJD0Z_08305 [Flavobacteriaceae bacterium M23B6Z8]